MTPPKKTGPRVNREIKVPQVRLIDHDGEQVGIVSVDEAMQRANDVSLDLVEIAPTASPPVCKILDVGKLKYQEQKKRSEARKKQKTIEIKEIKIRPNIDDHDYDVKMRSAKRFIGAATMRSAATNQIGTCINRSGAAMSNASHSAIRA